MTTGQVGVEASARDHNRRHGVRYVIVNAVVYHCFAIAELVVRNTDYVDGDAFAWALARHVQHRNGPHRAKRIRILQTRHKIAA